MDFVVDGGVHGHAPLAQLRLALALHRHLDLGVSGVGVWSQGLGVRGWGLGFRIRGLGFRVKD